MRARIFFLVVWLGVASVAWAEHGGPNPFPVMSLDNSQQFYDGAENGDGKWDRSDADPLGTTEYWGATNAESEWVGAGNYSFYSSRCTPLGGCTNGAAHTYAARLDSQMMLKDSEALDLTGFDHGALQFMFKVATDDDSGDYLTFLTEPEFPFFGNPIRIPSADIPFSEGTIAIQINKGVTKVGLQFVSDVDASRGHGALVDEIFVFGAKEMSEAEASQAPSRSVMFDGLASHSASESVPIEEYLWDFGDGQLGEGSLVRHNYGQQGLYRVELTVVDGLGNQATTFVFVNVVPEPSCLVLFASAAVWLMATCRAVRKGRFLPAATGG